MAELRDANTNPWYVLMTLYREQEGERVDEALHAKNRAVWNAWSCQGLDDDAAAVLAKQAEVELAETRGWAEMAAEVQRKHHAVMIDRNKDSAFIYPGLPDFEDFIRCSEIQFGKAVVLKNCIFTQYADFDNATFTQAASFHRAIFTQTASFQSASFTQTAYFNNATFIQAADFNSATFTQDASFYRATFTQDAYFDSATFTQDADFSSANFEGPARFVEAKFGVRAGNEICRADFTEAAFAKVVSFREADFVSHYPKLEGTQFREGVVLSAKATVWPDVGKEAADLDERGTEQAKESCAALRHALAKQGLPEEEHFFFRREMGFAAQIGGWWQRLPYRLFGWFSEYGDSISRPSLWLLGLWLVPALFLLCYFAWVGSFGDSVWRGIDAFGLSFANIFTVFGFHRLYFEPEQIRELPALLQVIGAAQTVLALPLLFFLGLALRKRFRLR